MATALTWLTRLCDPEHPSKLCQRPFQVRLGDDPYAVATNGRTCIAMRGGVTLPPEPGQEKNAQRITGWLGEVATNPDQIIRTTLDTLRAYVGPGTLVPPEVCELCGGNPGELHCEKDGEGCWIVRRGVMFGYPVNCWLAAQIFAHLGDDCQVSLWCELQNGGTPRGHIEYPRMHLRANGWRMLWMAMAPGAFDIRSVRAFQA